MSWTTHRIIGAEGVRLTVLAAGPADGRPILFLHGFAQSALSWKPTIAGPMAEEFRLLALDLRGHGGSDRPEHAYADGGVWAEDVAATIGQMGLNRPVLVGWSYGGTVIGDYLARYGGDRLSGIALVGACPKMGPSARPFIGPAGRTFPGPAGGRFRGGGRNRPRLRPGHGNRTAPHRCGGNRAGRHDERTAACPPRHHAPGAGP